MFCYLNATEWQYYNLTLSRPEVNVFVGTFAAMSIGFNFLVLYIAFRYVGLRSKINQWFVVLRTMADLLFGIVFLCAIAARHCLPRAFCGFFFITVWFTQITSVLCLLCLNCDRFIGLVWPLHYKTLVTCRSVVTQMITTVILSFSTAMTTYFINALGYLGPSGGYADVPVTECQFDAHPLSYGLILIIFYISPTVASMIISSYVFWVAQYKVQMLPISGSRHNLRRSEERRGSGRSRFARRMAFVYSATLWCLFTFLPYRIAYVVRLLYLANCNNFGQNSHNCELSQMFENLTQHMTFLLALGTVGNPIITIFTHGRYRDYLGKLTCSQKTGITNMLNALEASIAKKTHQNCDNDDVIVATSPNFKEEEQYQLMPEVEDFDV